MLGYRIKQTAFILAGLVVFFMTWERFVHIISGRYTGDLANNIKGEHVFTEIIWLAICLGGGEIVAKMTGGMNDAEVKPAHPSPSTHRTGDAQPVGLESKTG
jgi:hypothetical protein